MESTSDKRGYITRRYKNNRLEKRDLLLPHSIATLPLEKQCIYRRKLLSLLAIQIAFVGSIVCFATFQSDVDSFIINTVQNHFRWIPISYFVVVCMLGLLYIGRNIYIVNVIAFVCFSISQAALGIVCQVLFRSKAVVYTVVFTLFCLIIMIILSCSTTKRRHKSVNLELEQENVFDKQPIKKSFTFNSIAASMIAYSIMVVASLIYMEFITQEGGVITSIGFVSTLLFQGLFMIWLAWDTSILYKILTPEEYKHGIIYFYVDIMIALSITVLLFMAMLGHMIVVISVPCWDNRDLDNLACCCCCTDNFTLWDSGDCSNCTQCNGDFACCFLGSSVLIQTNRRQQNSGTDEDILPAYIEQV